MAVEVIGVDQSQIRECTCGNCASRLRYVLADRLSKVVSDYTGDRDTVYYIVCPKCSDQVHVRSY